MVEGYKMVGLTASKDGRKKSNITQWFVEKYRTYPHFYIERMKKAAADKGANAVLMMRFDTGDLGKSMDEVAAYGTAVTIRPLKQ
jgi:uncharacterized protein YbjQ (UPF0145 family)